MSGESKTAVSQVRKRSPGITADEKSTKKAEPIKNASLHRDSTKSKPKVESKASKIGVAQKQKSGQKKASAGYRKAPPTKKLARLDQPKKSHANPKVLKKIRMIQSQRDATKDISNRVRTIQAPREGDSFWDKEPQQDRIGLFVRDPFWLHVAWDITRNAVERAQAALAEQWHGAKPILRLMRLDDSSSSTSAETLQADIDIRGGVRNWYIPWNGHSATFRVSIGYLGHQGRFYPIAVSNSVKTPDATSPDATDDHWSHLVPEGERIFALSGGYDSSRDSGELKAMLESRLHRNLGAPELAKLAVAADMPTHYRSDFFFDMEVELVFYGATLPTSFVTINEEPVTLRPDGSFALRVPFPDRRHVIPAVAVTRDGSHQKTIVVGVERNTKVMEPFEREHDNSD